MSLLYEKFRKLKEVIISANPNPWYSIMVQAVNELEAVLPVEEIFTPVPAVEVIPTVEETEIVSISEEPLVETVTTESVKIDEVETPTAEETVAPKKGRKPSAA